MTLYDTQAAGIPATTEPESGAAVRVQRLVSRHQFHNVFSDSASAMASILAMHFPTGSIIDVNYGLGVFYKQCADRDITGVDVRPLAKIICCNSKLPFEADSYDIGVCDPPYKRGNGNTRYTDRYGKAPTTEQKCTRLYLAAMPELLRVCRRGMIVKCQDASDGHAFYPRHIQLAEWMKEQTGLSVHDFAVVVRHGVPNANTQGERHYFQQAVSFFLVWKWKTKQPWKPVRH